MKMTSNRSPFKLLAILGLLCLSNRVYANQNGELSFLVIGDWGGLNFFPYRTPIESAVAKQMGKTAQQLDAKFVVALGDNFYFHGVKNEDDDRFKETFENVFVAPSLQVPWYICAGNHDHYGNASAQIAYTEKSKTWTFPNYYYSKMFDIPTNANTWLQEPPSQHPWEPSGKVVHLVMIDTVLLCGNTEHDFIKGHASKGPHSLENAETQWSWLEQTLQASQADYLLVGGHFPVWSIAEHGPTQCLVDRLKPLLEKYHVTAYLCGHDHNLQHLKESSSPVEYFVIGAGAYVVNSTEHDNAVPDGSVQFFWANAFSYGGFASIQATSDTMALVLLDAEGRKLHTSTMRPRTSYLKQFHKMDIYN